MHRRPSAPIDGADLLLADLDGVVYKGPGAIPHAVETLNRIRASIPVGYVTNNAARSDERVAAHLRELGLDVDARDIVTSPQAAILLLEGLVPPGSRVLVVGGEGIVTELERHGYVPTRSAEDAPAAVLQGFAPEVDWRQLAEAAFALRAPTGEPGIPWVATNMDWTIPVARGTAPGNGTLVSAVHTATGRMPQVAGKPERAIFDAAVARFGATRPLVVGDRLDTDVLGANRAGIPAALVLTGIDGAKQVLAAPVEQRPRYLISDLRGLLEPYPDVVETAVEDGRVIGCGDAVVRQAGRVIRLVRAGAPVDVLRAGATAVWGAGAPIHALDVDPALYA